jgi:hypothetical protein
MKKYLTLIAFTLFISTANAQVEKNLDPKFIYEKLVDIFHKSLTMGDDAYFSEFGFIPKEPKNLPDGNTRYGAVNDIGADYFNMSKDEIFNGKGGKEFSFTIHSLSDKLYTTVESRYSTRSRKEYKSLLAYITVLGFKLISGDSKSMGTQTYQMDKLQLVFQKVNQDSRPYEISYTIIPD